MTTPPFEIIDHTADLALRITGDTFPQLLEHAAAGLQHLLGTPSTPGAPGEKHIITLYGNDREELLWLWLSELFHTGDEGNRTFAIESMQVTGLALHAVVTAGETVTPRTEIKAVTYHNLTIINRGGMLSVTVIFDV